MRKAYIYLITNTINDKVYVGQTFQTIEARFKKHCANARWAAPTRMPIVAAIRKYGEKHFHVQLLEEILSPTQQIVNDREIYWGLHYNALSPSGYNLKLGAGTGTLSEETKKKISLSNKGRKASAETRERLRLSHLGYVVSQKTKEKLSNHFKGKTPHINTALGASLKNAKTYKLLSPEGNIIIITNMRAFCKASKLGIPKMSDLVNKKITRYRGWTNPF